MTHPPSSGTPRTHTSREDAPISDEALIAYCAGEHAEFVRAEADYRTVAAGDRSEAVQTELDQRVAIYATIRSRLEALRRVEQCSSQVFDALESDATMEQRRDAWNALRDALSPPVSLEPPDGQ